MVEKKQKARNTSERTKSVWQFAILLVAILAINVAGDMVYRRFDLTKEKRYTLSQVSHDLVDQLEEPVYVQIFLDGEFPQEYRRLKNATRDLLNEFQHISHGKFEYRFDDLLTDKPIKDKEDILKQLKTKGVSFTQPEIGQDEATSERFIIPGGLVNYKGTEYPINLLKREMGMSLDEDINQSIELLEYEIANILRKCIAKSTLKVGFTRGHGELEPIKMADIAKTLDEYYEVGQLNINLNDTNCTKQFLSEMRKNPEESGKILINGVMDQLNEYSALVIAKPRMAFSNQELFLLDQYVMNGGKIIWLVEPLIAEDDTLRKYGSKGFMTADYGLNVNDLLFRYGARVNPDLIQDLNCHIIPVRADKTSGQGGYLPWIFYPRFAPSGEHPIVRNLSSVWGRYVASIDTLPNKSVKKTVLLKSSQTSRVAFNPVRVSLDILRLKPTPENFQRPNNIAGVLLEGSFRSVFAHRPAVKENSPIPFKDRVDSSAMIVLSDGDFIANQTNQDQTMIYPLGYDKFATRAMKQPIEFANKKFFLNCVDYLIAENNLIEVRSKKIEMRLLDEAKVKSEKLKWQTINMVVPVVLLLIFGLINFWIRKRKYT